MTVNAEAALDVLREQAHPEQRDNLPSYHAEESEVIDILKSNRLGAVEEAIAEQGLTAEEAEALRQAETPALYPEEETGESPVQAAPEPEVPAIPADAAYTLGQQAQEVATQRAQLQAAWQSLNGEYQRLQAQRIQLDASGLRQSNPGAYAAAITDLANAEASLQTRATEVRGKYGQVEAIAGQLTAAFQQVALEHEHRQAEQALKAMGLAFDKATKAALADVAKQLGYDPNAVSRARDVVLLAKLAQAEGKLAGGPLPAPEVPVETLDPVQAVIRERNLSPGSIEAVALHLQARDRGQRARPVSREAERDGYLAAARKMGYLR